MSRPDPARRAAYETLRAVAARDAYANLVLPKRLADAGADGRDAAFATELAYGTLRHRGTYDAVLAACVDRPLDRLDPPLLDVLRLGVHQVLRMRVPPHAAVSATVDLARDAVGPGQAKLANAVLRKVAGRDEAAWIAAVAPDRDADPAGHLAVAHAHPRWMVEAVREALGGSWDETAAALAADNEPAEVVLCARPGRCDPNELDGRAGRWSPYAVAVDGDPGRFAAVQEGRAGVQDEGSQLVALALARAGVDGASGPERWLDACAGPGGKAGLLDALAHDAGAHLLAAERRFRRARLVRQAVAYATVVAADATRPPWPDATFDRVLVDAPCTGLGALRRRPEARWRRDPGDVDDLQRVQRGLLDAALTAVRPGGVVAYATCSPHLAETRDVVAPAVAAGAEPVDVRPLLAGVPDLGDGPAVQLWPHRHGTDAMFVALLRRPS